MQQLVLLTFLTEHDHSNFTSTSTWAASTATTMPIRRVGDSYGWLSSFHGRITPQSNDALAERYPSRIPQSPSCSGRIMAKQNDAPAEGCHAVLAELCPGRPMQMISTISPRQTDANDIYDISAEWCFKPTIPWKDLQKNCVYTKGNLFAEELGLHKWKAICWETGSTQMERFAEKLSLRRWNRV